MVSILEKKRQIVTDYKVEVSGERRDEHPRSFTKFRSPYRIWTQRFAPGGRPRHRASDEKYCSVAATVRPTAQIETSFEIIEVESQTEAAS